MAQGVGLQVTTTPKDLATVSKKAQKGILKGVPRAVLRTGVQAMGIIQERTKNEKGYLGAFKPYSDQYLKKLKKEGRPQEIDLLYDNQMLRSMQVRRKDKRTAEIYFDNKEAAEKAAMNNKSRPFFGFNRKEEKALGEFFRKQL